MSNANTPARPAATAGTTHGNGAHTPALVTMLRLHWFIRLRWTFLGLAIIVLVLERALIPGVGRPLAKLAIVLGTLGGANLCWMALSYALFRHFRESSIGEESSPRRVQVFANGQVAVDLYLLTCILRFTGGAGGTTCVTDGLASRRSSFAMARQIPPSAASRRAPDHRGRGAKRTRAMRISPENTTKYTVTVVRP